MHALIGVALGLVVAFMGYIVDGTPEPSWQIALFFGIYAVLGGVVGALW